MKILLIEDDKLLGESLKEYLESNMFEVNYIYDDREIEYIDIDNYDLIILDLMLRYEKGEILINLFRRKNKVIPIIVISAKTDMISKEECYKKGADDYVTKPFNPKELLLKIKAILRRSLHVSEEIKIGNIFIDINKKVVKKDKKEIHLSKTSWDLMEFLLKNRGKVVSTDRIINCVWEDKPVNPEIVRVYIKELRKKLSPGFIKTYKGRGYIIPDE